ncbi:AcrR family transcriptional regulator [Aureimonas jatrophae]|nr:AcrR family transcriptional regulator [Aureimonas jatrophae]
MSRRIVEIAEERFLTDGFDATSMEAIAIEAGISKRTLYARFRSKPLLLQAVADHLFDPSRSEFTRYHERTDPPETVLRDMAHHMHRRVLMPFSIAVYRLVVSQSQRHRDDAGMMLGGERYLVPLVTALAFQFRRGAEQGTITDRWEPNLLAEQFLEAVCAWDLRRLVFGHELPQRSEINQALVDQRFELFFAGLRPLEGASIVADGGSRDARSSPSDAAALQPAPDRKRRPKCMSESRRSY